MRTFRAFRVNGISVLTAVTAQNTVGVQGVETLSPACITAQFESVVGDLGVDALKTGMLGTAAVVVAVVAMTFKTGPTNIVVDPVMVAKSGDQLFAEDAVHSLRTRLLPPALVITLSSPEPEMLVGGPIRTLDEMRKTARRLHALGPHLARAGSSSRGHGGGDTVTDLLYDGQAFGMRDSPRIDTLHTRGTGCTFSAAMTASLAQGKTVPEAFAAAKPDPHAAIAAAPGHGHLNYFVSPSG